MLCMPLASGWKCGLPDFLMDTLLEPIPLCAILLKEFMTPMKISINALSRDINVPPNRISKIVNGKRSIMVDTALCLGKYFGVSPEKSRKSSRGSPEKRVGRWKAHPMTTRGSNTSSTIDRAVTCCLRLMHIVRYAGGHQFSRVRRGKDGKCHASK